MVPHWILFSPDLNPLAVRLYLVLRQHADARGESFPSRRRLADLLHVSLPTLDKARQQLVEAGALTMDRRKGAGDEWLSCTYKVHWEPHGGGGKESSPGVAKIVTPPSQESYALTHTHLTNTQISDRSVTSDLSETGQQEPSSGANALEGPVTPAPTGSAVSVAPGATFDLFWSVYSRRVGKRAARAAWDKAIRDTDPAEIIAGARRYAEDPNREARFTAHPQTWLNAGRWEDEQLPQKATRPQTGGERRMDAYADIASKIGQRGITA